MAHRFSRIISLFALLALLAGTACSSPDDNDVDTPDAGVDDVDDEEVTADPDCVFQADCGDDEYCHDGQCHTAPECDHFTDWRNCVNQFNDIDEELGRRAYCGANRCRVACLIDQECPEGQLCSDHGQCIPFTGELTGEHPGGDEKAPLQAGVGQALMKFPIGLSIAGYGSRAATNDGRYVESLAASHGKMHGLYARGVALDDGQRQLIFLRAPIIFPTFAVHEGVARKLQEETGRDWRSSLVISGTHTHSGPARYWQLPDPDDLVSSLGMIGIDEFHEQSYEWMVESLAEAALDSLDDLAPAKMGWEVVEAFDTDDRIASDRWSEVPPFDDNRALLMRIDDLDDNPRALLISFGSHGTIHSGPLANNDVMVGMERELEYALGDEYGTYAPVMYFNQNGGSMSPRSGPAGHSEAQRFEAVGAQLVERTFETVRDMETTDDWTFEGHTLRFPITYEYFEYIEDAFSNSGQGYVYGGIMCPTDSGDHDTHTDPHDYRCLMGFHQLIGHRPVEILTKSQVSAFQLNDLTIVTMPGELTMPLGWQIQKHLWQTYDIHPHNSWTWGYAQDHMLYLVPTNLRGDLPPFEGISTPMAPDDYPDYAFSYLQGGYEAQMSPWGHNFGDFLVDRALEVVGLMRGEHIEPALPEQYPEEFGPRGHEPFPVDVTDSAIVGTITDQPPAQVERRQFVEVAWIGGDPGAEMPQAPKVTLERFDGEDFEPVTLRNHVPYDNREFVIFTRLRRDDDDNYEWVIYWEELADFPTGTYRFSIEGHHLAEEDGDRVPYQATTDAFDLVPSTAFSIDDVEMIAADTVRFRLSAPPAERPRYGVPGDPGAVSGSFRMHHRQVPTGEPISVEAFDRVEGDVDRQGGAIDIVSATATTADGPSGYPVTHVELTLSDDVAQGASIDLDIQAFDDFGNLAGFAGSVSND